MGGRLAFQRPEIGPKGSAKGRQDHALAAGPCLNAKAPEHGPQVGRVPLVLVDSFLASSAQLLPQDAARGHGLHDPAIRDFQAHEVLWPLLLAPGRQEAKLATVLSCSRPLRAYCGLRVSLQHDSSQVPSLGPAIIVASGLAVGNLPNSCGRQCATRWLSAPRPKLRNR